MGDRRGPLFFPYPAGKHDFQLLRYRYETVAAAIVQYCRKLNIPFPKKAVKTLTVYKSHIQVSIEYPPLKGAGWAFRQPDPGET